MGNGYFEKWEKHSLPSWKAYADKFGLGIACIRLEIASPEDPCYKNGSWQKLLAPDFIAQEFLFSQRFCLLDTDIQISPHAENIFDAAPKGMYSVVSSVKKIPMPRGRTLRQVAFLRHTYYSHDYPLDSSLLGNPFSEFPTFSLSVPSDYFCAGLLVLDRTQTHELKEWFYQVDGKGNFDVWEQTHLNSWVQERPHHWLPYEWQALWHLEMAWKYPFLYQLGDEINNSKLAAQCVEASLFSNHFLHFAGSWYESMAWENEVQLHSQSLRAISPDFYKFLQSPVTGLSKGKVLPRNKGTQG